MSKIHIENNLSNTNSNNSKAKKCVVGALIIFALESTSVIDIKEMFFDSKTYIIRESGKLSDLTEQALTLLKKKNGE